jgi:hypothetical protein
MQSNDNPSREQLKREAAGGQPPTPARPINWQQANDRATSLLIRRLVLLAFVALGSIIGCVVLTTVLLPASIDARLRVLIGMPPGILVFLLLALWIASRTGREAAKLAQAFQTSREPDDGIVRLHDDAPELPQVPPRMVREYRASQDLEWIPLRYKVLRWSISCAIWLVSASVLSLLIYNAIHGRTYGGAGVKGGVGLLFIGFWAGRDLSKLILRRRLGRLASGNVDLRRLAQEPDGELVHIRGRVRARETIQPIAFPGAAVFRRTRFVLGRLRMVQEAGVDFWVVDSTGAHVRVEVDGARLVARESRFMPVVSASMLLDGLAPDAVKQAAKGFFVDATGKPPLIAERQICDGDEVEIVGYKARVVDPTIESRLPHEVPLGPTLRSGRHLPLLISPAP